MNFLIFTDGASRGNPGPGGWGAIVIEEEKEIFELGGAEGKTTNNRMELMAAIRALKETPIDAQAVLYTDSSYVINGITKWIANWKRTGWRTRLKEEVLNKDLWMELDELVAERRAEWKYLGGHIGIRGNERCDEIATAFADGKKVDLYSGPIGTYPVQDILNISHDALLLVEKKQSSDRSKIPAYSYVSSIGGIVETHKTWAECEARVKGVKGARFKKAISYDEELEIIEEFQK